MPSRKKKKDPFEFYVNRELDINRKKLKALGIDLVHMADRTPGEKLISMSLKKTSVLFIPQFIVENLRFDNQKFRIVDFCIFDKDRGKIFVEYCGMINLPLHRKRYEIKREVFLKNNLLCVFLYPQDLDNVDERLKQKLMFVKINGRSWNPRIDGHKRIRSFLF